MSNAAPVEPPDQPDRAAPVTAVRITDVRSVWGPPLEVTLGGVTVLVGPNRAGTSNVAFAVVLALDGRVPFRVERDVPRRGIDPHPRVEVLRDGALLAAAAFDPHRGGRSQLAGDVAGHVVACRIEDTPRDTLRRAVAAGVLDATTEDARAQLAQRLAATARSVVPEVERCEVDEDLTVRLVDGVGAQLPVPLTRAALAVGTAWHLIDEGAPPTALVVEAPEAFLHPAAQEAMAQLLVDVAELLDAPVVVTTASPFVIPRVASTQVVALARDAVGRTHVVGSAHGDAAQAPLLGGLLRDGGLAAVLDRVGGLAPDTRAVLLVEGGTDAAYLDAVAACLGREAVLAGVDVRPCGGAMAAALAAVLLRAETQVPLLVLLDHDDPGRRARSTLVSRFDFVRGAQVVTYADVFEGHPLGVEAETLFDLALVRRFVAEHGRGASLGEHVVQGLPHVELTAAGKSAFVGWVAEHARPEHLERWSALLDLLDVQIRAAG